MHINTHIVTSYAWDSLKSMHQNIQIPYSCNTQSQATYAATSTSLEQPTGQLIITCHHLFINILCLKSTDTLDGRQRCLSDINLYITWTSSQHRHDSAVVLQTWQSHQLIYLFIRHTAENNWNISIFFFICGSQAINQNITQVQQCKKYSICKAPDQ